LTKHLTLDQPATCQIKVPTELDTSWVEWTGSMTLSVDREGDEMPITTLTDVFKQAAFQSI
jgi:hypothetical protein